MHTHLFLNKEVRQTKHPSRPLTCALANFFSRRSRSRSVCCRRLFSSTMSPLSDARAAKWSCGGRGKGPTVRQAFILPFLPMIHIAMPPKRWHFQEWEHINLRNNRHELGSYARWLYGHYMVTLHVKEKPVIWGIELELDGKFRVGNVAIYSKCVSCVTWLTVIAGMGLHDSTQRTRSASWVGGWGRKITSLRLAWTT